PRPGAVAARARVRARRALAGRLRPADRLPRDPPELDGADRRLREPARAPGDPVRGRPLVPRGRRLAPHRELGLDDRGRGAELRHAVVVHAVPWRGAAVDGARVQPPGRRRAGRPRPEGTPMTPAPRKEGPTMARILVRTLLLSALCATAAIALAACGSSHNNGVAGKRGGTLRLLTNEDIASLDP